jgi:hypothetical protein
MQTYSNKNKIEKMRR